MTNLIRKEDRPLSEAEARDLTELTDNFRGMENLIKANVPAGREQALALTKLQEAAFWATEGLKK